jgi:branched-chain amino acid transport system permease protein
VSFDPILADLSTFGSMAVVWALLALGLNIQWGHGGLFNAGVAGFWAIGAYTAAIISTPWASPDRFGYPGHLGGFASIFPNVGGFETAIVVGFLAAMILSAGIAFLIALPVLRLRADYLAIATLGLAEIARIFLKNLEEITAGSFGIARIPRPFTFLIEPLNLPSRLSLTLSEASFLLLALGLLFLGFVLLERMTRSPWGRVLKAIREDEDVVQAIGKNTYNLKLQAFVLGAAIMGAAGALYAHFTQSIEPVNSFTPLDTFQVWVMVIIGGAGNNRGVILGAFLIWGFDFATRRMKDWFSLGDFVAERIFFLRLIVIGLILILLVIYRPQGVLKEPARVSREPSFLLGSP